MKVELIPPKPSKPNVQITMTMDEAQELRSVTGESSDRRLTALFGALDAANIKRAPQ